MPPDTATPVEPVAPVAPAPAPFVMPVEITFARPRPLQVVLVGAGGTGARLAPDLARLLTRGDKLIVIDPDSVEERNLTRQHFVKADVGRYKAEVVARRAQVAAGPGVTVEAKIATLTSLGDIPAPQAPDGYHLPTLWIGAVDTRSCRAMAAREIAQGQQGHIWLDAGNELRGGQVGIMAFATVISVTQAGKTLAPSETHRAKLARMRETREYTEQYLTFAQGAWVHVNTLLEEVPQVLKPDPVAEGATPDCGVRMDTQSLAANVMAYACLVNLASRVIDGMPISSGMAFFSTANSMVTKPFKGCRVFNGYPNISVVTCEDTSARTGLADLGAYQRLIAQATTPAPVTVTGK